jgi:hypothetical protein
MFATCDVLGVASLISTESVNNGFSIISNIIISCPEA